MKKYSLLLIVLMINLQNLVFGSFSSSRLRLGNIKFLAGATQLLPDELKKYSPVFGLPIIDYKVAQNIDYFSVKRQAKKMIQLLEHSSGNSNAITQVKVDLEKQKNNGTQALTGCLFNEVNGQLLLTNAPNNPIRLLTPFDIGSILRIVHQANQAEAMLKPIVSEKYKNIEAQIRSYLINLHLKKETGEEFKSKEFNPFIRSLIESLQESDPANKNAVFPVNTPEELLIGFAWSKMNSRQAVASYLQGLLNKPVQLPERMYSVQELREFAKTQSDFSDFDATADYVCGYAYADLYDQSIPPLTDSEKIYFKEISFSNCVETTIYNLANIASYDHASATLGNPVNKKNIEQPPLIASVSKNPDEVNLLKTKQNFSNLIQNHSGVSYNRLVSPDGQNFMINSSSSAGFIPVKNEEALHGLSLQKVSVVINAVTYELNQVTQGAQTYILVPEESGLTCCELMPTIANIVIVMNHVLNLDLYDTSVVVPDTNFEQKYFTKLCEMLNWKISYTDFEKQLNAYAANSSNHIKVSVELASGEEFMINLFRVHGYIEVKKNQKNLKSEPITIEIYEKYPILATAMCALNTDVLTKNLLDQAPVVLRDINLLDVNKQLSICKQLVQSMHQEPSQVKSILLVQLINSLSVAQDPYFFNEIIEPVIGVLDDKNLDIQKSFFNALLVASNKESTDFLFKKILLKLVDRFNQTESVFDRSLIVELLNKIQPNQNEDHILLLINTYINLKNKDPFIAKSISELIAKISAQNSFGKIYEQIFHALLHQDTKERVAAIVSVIVNNNIMYPNLELLIDKLIYNDLLPLKELLLVDIDQQMEFIKVLLNKNMYGQISSLFIEYIDQFSVQFTRASFIDIDKPLDFVLKLLNSYLSIQIQKPYIQKMIKEFQRDTTQYYLKNELRFFSVLLNYLLYKTNSIFDIQFQEMIEQSLNLLLKKMMDNDDPELWDDKLNFLEQCNSYKYKIRPRFDTLDLVPNEKQLFTELAYKNDNRPLTKNQDKWLRDCFLRKKSWDMFPEILKAIHYASQHADVNYNVIIEAINIFIQYNWNEYKYFRPQAILLVNALKAANFPLDEIDFFYLARGFRQEFTNKQEAIKFLEEKSNQPEYVELKQQIFDAYKNTNTLHEVQKNWPIDSMHLDAQAQFAHQREQAVKFEPNTDFTHGSESVSARTARLVMIDSTKTIPPRKPLFPKMTWQDRMKALGRTFKPRDAARVVLK